MQPKKVLVIGKNGQLGSSIKKLVEDSSQMHPVTSGVEFAFVSREELDLASQDSITTFFAKNTYSIIINCAAYTAVDKAETDAELADLINHQAVKMLAKIAQQQNAVLIHVSTDYVFNGENFKPYVESDSVDPQGVYGLTKLKGEQAFLEVNPKGCIIRTSWVYSEFGNNFVKTMLRLGKERDELGVIFDQVGTPTYATDLAAAILAMLNSECSMLNEANTDSMQNASCKIYHYSNEGVCSWYDFAKTIFELSGIECRVNPIETKDYPTPAKRPHYSVMNKAKIKADFDLQIPYWCDSLRQCLMHISKLRND